MHKTLSSFKKSYFLYSIELAIDQRPNQNMANVHTQPTSENICEVNV